LAQIHSIWKHTPELGRGVPVVKITLESGKTELPPFLFYHGGVRELFHAVRTLVPMSKAKDDPDLYLINDQSNLLYQSISCAEEFPENETPGENVEVPIDAGTGNAGLQPNKPKKDKQGGTEKISLFFYFF
jgi:hypothetical protein